MNDTVDLNNFIDSAREIIVKLARDPIGARLLVPGFIATLKEELDNTDWQPRFEELGRSPQTLPHTEIHDTQQLLEALLVQLKAQPIQETAKKATKKSAKRPIPKNLPPGTMFAKDFWSICGVPHGRYRQHVERGINGDFPETTDRIPYPDARPNYKERFVTPDNRSAIFAFWDRHEVDYTAPESNEEVLQ